MQVVQSYVCGAIDKLNAFKCALIENLKSEKNSDFEFNRSSTSPGCDMKFMLYGGTVCYVYPIGRGYYRVDFTCDVDVTFDK